MSQDKPEIVYTYNTKKSYQEGAKKAAITRAQNKAKRRKTDQFNYAVLNQRRSKPDPRGQGQRTELEVRAAHPSVLRQETLLGDAKHLPRVGSGVYFLTREGEVVYVGSSIEISRRVGDHGLDKVFDGVRYISLGRNQMHRVEMAFIRVLRPVYNREALSEPEASERDRALIQSLL